MNGCITNSKHLCRCLVSYMLSAPPPAVLFGRGESNPERGSGFNTRTMVAEDVEMNEEVVEETAAAEVEVKEISVLDALKEVLKKALIFDGLRRGLHE